MHNRYIPLFEEFVNETRLNEKYCYHILDFDRLKHIVTSDKLSGKNYGTISFTTNKNMISYLGAPPQSFYRLSIDLEKLKNDYIVEEFDYVDRNGKKFDEDEVRIGGVIKQPFKYITAIIIDFKRILNLFKEYKDFGKRFKLFSEDYDYNIKNQMNYIEDFATNLNIPILNNDFKSAEQNIEQIYQLEFKNIDFKKVILHHGKCIDKKTFEIKECLIIQDKVIFDIDGDIEIDKSIYENPTNDFYNDMLKKRVVKIDTSEMPLPSYYKDYIRGYETNEYIFTSLNRLMVSLYHNVETDTYILKYF
jgi:hypothetical protein